MVTHIGSRIHANGRLVLLGTAAAALFLTSCSSNYYRKDADLEVYHIIDQAEQDVFGRRNTNFTINTRYSDRAPDAIPADEIIFDRQQSNALFMTIEDALDLAVRNSREYQTEKEQLYLTALGLTGSRYQFGPQFFAGADSRFSGNSSGDMSFGAGAQAGVSQLLKSGGNLGLTLANDFLRYYSSNTRNDVVSIISVNLSQPLLRGFGSDIAAESLKQAERDVIYAMRSHAQFQRQFAVDIVLLYFALLQDKDQVRNAYDDYQRRLETIRYTEARGEAGIVRQLEVDQAKTEELSAKNSYIQAATAYRNNLDRFKLTLGLPLTTQVELDDTALKQLAEVGLKQLRLDRDHAFSTAVTNHLELLNDIDRFEDSKRKVKLAVDDLRPGLDFTGNAQLNSNTPDYTEFDVDNITYSAGLQFDLPIDPVPERNAYRARLVSFESAIRNLGRRLDDKKDQIDRGLRNLEALRRSYAIAQNQLETTERRVAGEQLSLQAGRATLRDVREAQDDLVTSQNQVTAALVTHLAAKLQLLLDVGILDTRPAQFWVKPDAVLIPLPELAPGQEILPPVDEIITPDQVFGLR